LEFFQLNLNPGYKPFASPLQFFKTEDGWRLSDGAMGLKLVESVRTQLTTSPPAPSPPLSAYGTFPHGMGERENKKFHAPLLPFMGEMSHRDRGGG